MNVLLWTLLGIGVALVLVAVSFLFATLWLCGESDRRQARWTVNNDWHVDDVKDGGQW